MRIVDVTLAQEDHPQLVFESLNSTGVDLSQSDLIRNYLLMRLSDEEQTRLYEDYWNPIEVLFKRSNRDLTLFLRDYVALQRQDNNAARNDRIYEEFKLFAPAFHEEGQLEKQLENMRTCAGYYSKFRGIQRKNPRKYQKRWFLYVATAMLRLSWL